MLAATVEQIRVPVEPDPGAGTTESGDARQGGTRRKRTGLAAAARNRRYGPGTRARSRTAARSHGGRSTSATSSVWATHPERRRALLPANSSGGAASRCARGNYHARRRFAAMLHWPASWCRYDVWTGLNRWNYTQASPIRVSSIRGRPEHTDDVRSRHRCRHTHHRFVLIRGRVRGRAHTPIHR